MYLFRAKLPIAVDTFRKIKRTTYYFLKNSLFRYWPIIYLILICSQNIIFKYKLNYTKPPWIRPGTMFASKEFICPFIT